jgi:hypothetical protein
LRVIYEKEFIEKSRQIHNNKYDYSKVLYYNTFKDVIIICKKHGEFLQKPNSHVRKCGCPRCNESRGEVLVRKILDKLKISYEREKKFENCKNMTYLPFDFYLPEYNYCIEFDGIQHYKEMEFFGGKESFEKLKINDDIKDQYCIDNNIKLIRIRYDEDIENILDSYFKK